jgi:hypothetical protein
MEFGGKNGTGEVGPRDPRAGGIGEGGVSPNASQGPTVLDATNGPAEPRSDRGVVREVQWEGKEQKIVMHEYAIAIVKHGGVGMNLKLTPDVRNDSTLPIAKVEELLNAPDVVDFTYGGVVVRAQRTALEEARQCVSDIPPAEREDFTIWVEVALDRAIPKMESGKFPKKTADDFFNDLLLWEALKQ